MAGGETAMAHDAATSLMEEQRPVAVEAFPARRRLRCAGAGAGVTGAAAVTLLVCGALLFRAPASIQRTGPSGGFLAEYADEEIFQDGNQMFKHSCKPSSTYTLKQLLHNNFGGAGPDQGDEGIVIKAERHKPDWLCPDGDCFEEVNIELHAKSPYNFHQPQLNGMMGGFATISLSTGDSVEVQLLVKDFETGEIVEVPFLPLSVYDIDENNDGSGAEYVIAHSRHTTTLKSNAKVIMTKHARGHIYEAEVGQGMADNPTNPTHLSPDQASRSVAFNFIKPKEVRFTIGSMPGTSLRIFSFSLYNALSTCFDTFLYDVTTASPTTTTAKPTTSTSTAGTSKATTSTTTTAPTTTTTSTSTTTTTTIAAPVQAAPVQAAPKKQDNSWLQEFACILFVAVAILLYRCLYGKEARTMQAVPATEPQERRRLTIAFGHEHNELKTCSVTRKPTGMIFGVGIFPLLVKRLAEDSELHRGGIRAGMQVLRFRWETQRPAGSSTSGTGRWRSSSDSRASGEWQAQPWQKVPDSGNWHQACELVTSNIDRLPAE